MHRLKKIAALMLLAAGLSGCGGTVEVADPAERIPDWQTYYNREIGIALRYPYTLSLDIDTTTVPGQLALELQWIGRGTTMFALDTRQATELDYSAGEGEGDTVQVGGKWGARSPTEVDGEKTYSTLVTHNERAFTFTGKGATFDKILESVEFLGAGAALPGR